MHHLLSQVSSRSCSLPLAELEADLFLFSQCSTVMPQHAIRMLMQQLLLQQMGRGTRCSLQRLQRAWAQQRARLVLQQQTLCQQRAVIQLFRPPLQRLHSSPLPGSQAPVPVLPSKVLRDCCCVKQQMQRWQRWHRCQQHRLRQRLQHKRRPQVVLLHQRLRLHQRQRH